MKKWIGTWPAQCDICGDDLHDESYFVDGRTKFGPWALLCPDCHKISGMGLGPGKGQKYDTNTLEKLEG